MKAGIALVWFILFNADLSAQVAQPAGKLNVNTAPGGIVEEIYFDKIPETKGSYYLFDDWITGNIYVKSGQKLEGKPMKYDLKAQVIRIRFERVVKALKISKILRFELIGPDGNKTVFINVDQFQDENLPAAGFFRVVQQGSLRLLGMTKLRLVKANYVPTHDVGEKSDEYVKTDHFYFEKDSSVFKIPKSKKKALEYFDEESADVKRFVSDYNLGFKKEEDLIEIVKFYNSVN